MSRLALALVSALLHAPLASSLDSPGPRLVWHGNWAETDNETLWRRSYTNEDYGYSVVLSHGAIGHGTHSPSPNHGFMVPLPDVRTMSSVSSERARFIWVDATYDASDYPEPSASKDQPKRNAFLAGRHAVETIKLVPSSNGRLIEDSILVRRCGIVYTVSLRTLQKNRAADRQQFEEIVRGFHFLALRATDCR